MSSRKIGQTSCLTSATYEVAVRRLEDYEANLDLTILPPPTPLGMQWGWIG